jgi:hypothetical protein
VLIDIAESLQPLQELGEVISATWPGEPWDVLQQDGSRPQELDRREHCRQPVARIVCAPSEAPGRERLTRRSPCHNVDFALELTQVSGVDVLLKDAGTWMERPISSRSRRIALDGSDDLKASL